jgi:hypothetical protein
VPAGQTGFDSQMFKDRLNIVPDGQLGSNAQTFSYNIVPFGQLLVDFFCACEKLQKNINNPKVKIAINFEKLTMSLPSKN